MSDDSLVAHFIAVTGSTEDQAIQMLEATNNDLEEAVGLYFAADMPTEQKEIGDGGRSLDHADASRVGQGVHSHEADEELARRLQHEDAQASFDGEEQVRAPLPTRTERLYGDTYVNQVRGRATTVHPVVPNVVDAFRDFAGGQPGSSTGGDNLASMFEPPRDILFLGSFEEAKEYAVSQERWLLVNVQSTSEFASHQLNRDTWGNATLKELVKGSFVLFQAYDITEDGQKLSTFYKLYEVPSILVLDPLTGAPMKQWTGFVDAMRLMEDLMPFLDTSFTDPGAARLAASAKRINRASSGSSSLPRKNSSSEQQNALLEHKDDETMQQALLDSLVDQNKSADSAMEIGTQADEKPEEASDPGRLVAEAEARLPEEPIAPQGCRIGLRLPDGRRVQRRFPEDAAISSIRDWCIVQVPDAANGKEFCLSEATPGAVPLKDMSLTIAAAGIKDAMLVMKWNT